MAKGHWLALFLGLALAAFGAEGPGEIWLFQGGAIPAAPQQDQFWEPPATGIPAEYIDAVAAAFGHGLADPRGCEYLEVTVPAGSDSFGGFYRLKTHGWLLPETDESSPPFAVLWNGLVCPVIATGSAASVEEDVRKLLAYVAQRNAQDERWMDFAWHDRPGFPGIFPPDSFSYKAMCALLLRLGETELAEEIYDAAIRRDAESDPGLQHDGIQKFVLWELFSRALAAHMYGDDRLALAYAEQYEPLIGDQEGEFESTARALLAEQRRRARPQPVAQSDIDALILDLENVDQRQWGQPGGVPLSIDERVQALIAAGDAAVEPLLECLEHDQRLTRSVSFFRNFVSQRTNITVAEAAYVALCEILQQSFGIAGERFRSDMAYRREIAQQIRGHYNRYKTMTNEDKWYRILQNDDETMEAQLQAAANICRKNSGQLAGEALRAKNNPSVSELFQRRAAAAALSGALGDAQKMALFSAEWDLPASQVVLREVGDAIYRELPRLGGVKAFRLLAPLTIRRAEAGDPAALRQYCETLLANPGRVLEQNGSGPWEEYLRPLYTFPEEPAVIAAAEEIFNTPGNGWSWYFGAFQDARKLLLREAFAGMMRLAPYRRHVLNGLDDRTGLMKSQAVIADNRVSFEWKALDGLGSGSYSGRLDSVKNDPLFPGDRSTQILRVCDVYAKYLAGLPDGGYPAFQNYWDEKDRDRAIERIASGLSRTL